MRTLAHGCSRGSLAAAVIALAALAVPTAARAQTVTPERALLNRADPDSSSVRVDSSIAGWESLSGERALLNWFAAPPEESIEYAGSCLEHGGSHEVCGTDGGTSAQDTVNSQGGANPGYPSGTRALLNREDP
jgi:hypothetical protein